jgi:hypothetical protein
MRLTYRFSLQDRRAEQSFLLNITVHLCVRANIKLLPFTQQCITLLIASVHKLLLSLQKFQLTQDLFRNLPLPLQQLLLSKQLEVNIGLLLLLLLYHLHFDIIVCFVVVAAAVAIAPL